MRELQGDFFMSPTSLQDPPVAFPTWSVAVTPAAAAQAIATKSAGAAGVIHVLYGVSASIACGATAQTPLTVQVLDGAAVIWTSAVAAPVDGVASINVTGLHIPGTAATSMTLQFSGVGVAASQQAVTLIGYDVA